MVKIRPFKAVRPERELAEKVAALPYDVLNREEAKEAAKDNPYSFLHVDKAEIDFDDSVSDTDELVYETASLNLQWMVGEGVLRQDELPSLYIYELEMNGRTQTGLAACTSVEEYEKNIIKKHEVTREKKEIDRIRHMESLNAHTGPIMMAYKQEEQIDKELNEWKSSHDPVYSFQSEDGVVHRLWVIDKVESVNRLVTLFENVENLYIADGHHRSEAAAKVAQQRRKQQPDYNGEEEYNSFLAVVFPSNELEILDYNRIVTSLNGYTTDKFLQLLGDSFDIEKVEKASAKPDKKHQVGMYLDGAWYRLHFKGELSRNDDDIINTLDVSILQNYVLSPLLEIKDIRSDERIDFVGGIRGTEALEKHVDSGNFQVAFALHPTSIEELMTVADQNLIMPPKSTWFEPKLRSGLLIHPLE
ncbi:DUF1015 domain-containing protein [Falsibacillus albus]|uniref:DUF1015 domain-containing protein n=1 Tax=Falsibacillus albus TaxID=2478915 RepID=A0A3L7K7Y6_9BACI|nr:DUF1015 family protein [Falsibacillus albus]RLQ96842.1 DUF1015 domain-containing protein [Falsibacillus albus]